MTRSRSETIYKLASKASWTNVERVQEGSNNETSSGSDSGSASEIYTSSHSSLTSHTTACNTRCESITTDDDKCRSRLEKIAAARMCEIPYDLKVLRMCLRMEITPVDSLMDSKCKLCKSTYSPWFNLIGPETSVQLPCCGQLIGHKCIYDWLRPSGIHGGKGATRCPFGCLLVDGENISGKDRPANKGLSMEQGMCAAPHGMDLSLDGVYSGTLIKDMTSAERAFWMSKSYRLRRSVLNIVKFGRRREAVPKR